MNHLNKLLLLCALFASVSIAAKEPAASNLKSMTEQLKHIKAEDKYKIFTMSGEGLVAQIPQKPATMRDAFSSDIKVSAVTFRSDSTDANGNKLIESIKFTRPDGSEEITVGRTLGLVPISTTGTDRDGSSRFIVAVDGNIYFLKSLKFAAATGATGPEITEIISTEKLAGIKGDPKSEELYQQKVYDYVNAMQAEQARIIAAAIEKRRKENSLEGRDVKSIDFSSESTTVTPGRFTSIGITANLKDGSQLKTLGFAKGGTFWSDYTVTVSGGSFSNGNLTLPEEFDASIKDMITVNIVSVYHPELKITKTFNVSYAHDYEYDLRSDGMYGYAANGGTAGDCVSGKSAGDGKNGNNGGGGSNAGVVTVKIAPYTHAQTKQALLKYEITTNGSTQHIVVTPESKVVMHADGGNGGSGGSGGNAGDVKKINGDCDCDGSSAYMGYGGNGGNGGNGGSGGNVTVIVDPSVTTYNFNATTLAGYGGTAGRGGSSDPAPGCSNAKSVSATLKSNKGQDGTAGNNGQPGKISTRKEKVVLSW